MTGLLSLSSFVGQPMLAHTCGLSHTTQPQRVRTPFSVEAQKKVKKQQQVVLTENIPGIGAEGELTNVANGYFRNYLLPQRMAKPATPTILAQIQAKIDAEGRAALEVKSKAQAMATALSTIGKFIVKKKVGESNQIFGSVTAQEIVDAIEMQTGRKLDKKNVDLPEMKTTGSYDASVKLHPEVFGRFKVVVQKLKNT